MIVSSTPSNVSWFSSSQSGMPSIYGQDPSGILKILDACLVQGGADRNVLTTVIIDNEVTLNFGSGHDLNLYQNILITGADDSSINGIHKIISITNNSVTINVIGALIDTGAIKARIAPLGYQSIFGMSDPLKRAYRSLSSTSNKRVLYLDMGYPVNAGYDATNPARRAMVSMCEDMQTLGVQINSFTDGYNNTTYKNGRLFWYQARSNVRANAIDNSPVSWVVIGNGDFFYLCIAWSQYSGHKNQNLKDVYGFGEYIGLGSANPDTTFLMSNDNIDDSSTAYTGEQGAYFSSTSSSSFSAYIISDGGVAKRSIIVLNGSGGYSGQSSGTYPSSAGDFLFTHTTKVLDANKSIIGFIPSLLFIEHDMLGGYDSQVIDGCLIVRTNKTASTTVSPANLGFYVGA